EWQQQGRRAGRGLPDGDLLHAPVGEELRQALALSSLERDGVALQAAAAPERGFQFPQPSVADRRTQVQVLDQRDLLAATSAAFHADDGARDGARPGIGSGAGGIGSDVIPAQAAQRREWIVKWRLAVRV